MEEEVGKEQESKEESIVRMSHTHRIMIVSPTPRLAHNRFSVNICF